LKIIGLTPSVNQNIKPHYRDGIQWKTEVFLLKKLFNNRT